MLHSWLIVLKTPSPPPRICSSSDSSIGLVRFNTSFLIFSSPFISQIRFWQYSNIYIELDLHSVILSYFHVTFSLKGKIYYCNHCTSFKWGILFLGWNVSESVTCTQKVIVIIPWILFNNSVCIAYENMSSPKSVPIFWMCFLKEFQWFIKIIKNALWLPKSPFTGMWISSKRFLLSFQTEIMAILSSGSRSINLNSNFGAIVILIFI